MWPITLLFILDDRQSPRYDPLHYSSFMMILSKPVMTHYVTLHAWWSPVTQLWHITLRSFMMNLSNPGMTHYVTLDSWWSSVTQVWPVTLLFIHDDPKLTRYDPLRYYLFIMILSYPDVTHYFTLHSWWSSVTRVRPITLLFFHDDPQ